MKRVHENIFSNLTLNFPLFLPSLKEGLQSQRAASDFRQHVSLALERQLSGQLANSYASSLINLPINTQQQQPPTFHTTTSTKPAKHPPLTASNSIANCTSLKTQHRKLDRSASEPADRSCSRQQQPQPLNSSRYKTELCRPFEESGTCKYGDKCQFAHGYAELRTLSRHPKYKTELCRTFHSTGFCPYGPRCHFIHNSEDSKRCLLDTLQSNNSPLSPNSVDCDISGFSLGSAGELSPNSSSSGSCASSLSGYYPDDPRISVSQTFLEDTRLSVPQTAPPTMTSCGFFNGEFVSPMEDYMATSEDDVPSSIDMLMSELEESLYESKLEESLYEMEKSLYDPKPLDSFYESKPVESLYELQLEKSVYEPKPEPLYEPKPVESKVEESLDENQEAKKTESAAVDINRNLIRLPIFSRLSLGSSP